MCANSKGKGQEVRPGFDQIELTTGSPLPLGATVRNRDVNFAVFSKQAQSVTLVLFVPEAGGGSIELPLDPTVHRTGDVWHVGIRGLPPGVEYGYRVAEPDHPESCHPRSDKDRILLDPYARALCGGEQWRRRRRQRIRPRRSCVVVDAFNWEGDRPVHTHLADSILYELHVRGFTRHPSSRVAHPGTFLGVVEKIPYLQELGVTAVELMPIAEFEENANPHVNPQTGEPLLNFWGYDPIAMFAPKASYATRAKPGSAIAEFKTMVKALHAAGIEVILDVVFNHTGEGDEHCPTWSFRGLDNATYYLLDAADGGYRNFTGCGNTLNANHPVVQDLIIECLRYWVSEMHIDGVRFDLAAILCRGQDGEVLPRPPLIERITADPVLARTKLIAEPWDAAGLYQAGTFAARGRWAEWNDTFRDDVRRFVKGDPGMVPRLAERLAGSPDRYRQNGGAPYHSINFITCHDGFTLMDLVSFTDKHNAANGEGGKDGAPANFSWNCGVEGVSNSPAIRNLRRRQMKNMATLLLLAQGVPMLLSGDEMGRTQQGNNNAYCHDNALTWVDWHGLDQHAELFRFFKLLIRFRRRHPVLRYRRYLDDSDQTPALTWHGCRINQPDWSWESRSLAMHLIGGREDVDLFLVANAHWEGHTFELPAASGEKRWHHWVDTRQPAPRDILDDTGCRPLADAHGYQVGPRTVVVLVGR